MYPKHKPKENMYFLDKTIEDYLRIADDRYYKDFYEENNLLWLSH